MVKITKHLTKKFDLPVSLETVNVSRNLLGISRTAFSFLIETPSLLASLVFLFLPEAQEFLQVQQHLSNMTKGYPEGAWVLDDNTEPYHLWTAYCRLPSSREEQTPCLFNPLCFGSLGSPWPDCLPSALVHYSGARWQVCSAHIYTAHGLSHHPKERPLGKGKRM